MVSSCHSDYIINSSLPLTRRGAHKASHHRRRRRHLVRGSNIECVIQDVFIESVAAATQRKSAMLLSIDRSSRKQNNNYNHHQRRRRRRIESSISVWDCD